MHCLTHQIMTQQFFQNPDKSSPRGLISAREACPQEGVDSLHYLSIDPHQLIKKVVLVPIQMSLANLIKSLECRPNQ